MDEERKPKQLRTVPAAEPPSLSETLVRMAIAVLIGTCFVALVLSISSAAPIWGIPIFYYGPIGAGFGAGIIAANKKRGLIAGFLSGLAGTNIMFLVWPLLHLAVIEENLLACSYLLRCGFLYASVVLSMILGPLAALGGALGGKLREGWTR